MLISNLIKTMRSILDNDSFNKSPVKDSISHFFILFYYYTCYIILLGAIIQKMVIVLRSIHNQKLSFEIYHAYLLIYWNCSPRLLYRTEALCILKQTTQKSGAVGESSLCLDLPHWKYAWMDVQDSQCEVLLSVFGNTETIRNAVKQVSIWKWYHLCAPVWSVPVFSNANLTCWIEHVKGEMCHALCGSALLRNEDHWGGKFLSDGDIWVIIVLPAFIADLCVPECIACNLLNPPDPQYRNIQNLPSTWRWAVSIMASESTSSPVKGERTCPEHLSFHVIILNGFK